MFDLAGQLASVSNAENETTTYTYDPAGNLETVTDPIGRVTAYGYDEVNRRIKTTLPSNDVGSTVFDVAGQVETSTSPGGFTASYTYDQRGLVESITDELGNQQISGYDGAGRLLTATDARCNDTTFTCDPNGRTASETDPLGGTVTFGYDLAGQRTSLTDPNNAERTFAYDDGGRMVTAVDAENRATSYTYDAVSRRTTITDARGITITSVFDDAGQLIAQTSPNENRTFSYDDAGRNIAFTDASGLTSAVYDDAGRMTSIVTPAGTVGYSYNNAGEQTSMTQPEGTVAYGYDVNGYMDSLTDWRGDTITMTNDPDGRMETVARSNNVDTSYSYDLAGRLTSIGHTAGATVVDSFTYSLDGNGNRTGVTSNAGAESYTLDGLNRITAAAYPGNQSETFTYDPAGNRTSHTAIDGTTTGYTVDATGQLISDTSGTTYDYDPAGNLIETSDGESYVYDDYSRATEITAAGVTETYTYDAQDVRATVNGVTQLWDRAGLPTLIETGDGNNYIHTNSGVARDGDEWLLADAVGSVRVTVDNAGAVSAETAFTAYGEPLTGDADNFGFAGEQLDTTGLLHLRARQYNPTVGRFTTVDPVQPGAPGTTGYNLYTYSGNNPTTWTDPTGQTTLTEYGTLAARGALLGASFSAALTPWTCDQVDNAWYEPSTSIDSSCVLTEIALGAIFGGLGGAFAGRGASIGRAAAVACGWGPQRVALEP